MTGRRALPVVLAGLGALQTLAFVYTSAWALSLAATGLLALAVADAPPRRAALLGWAFGTGWLVAGTWWLFISMHRYGGLPAPLAVLAVGLLAAALSLYLALAMAAFARWRSGRPLADAALFSALWTLAELARGELFTGFPWVAAGYAQVDGPLAALAPWIGVYGIGAWGAFAAACAALRRSIGGWGLAVALVLAPVALQPIGFGSSAGTLKVALLQPNVPQDEKFATERMPEVLDWLGRTMVRAPQPLVVAPETAVPLLPMQLADFAPGWWDALAQHFAAPGRAALVGLPLGDYESGYTNSVAGLSAAPAYRYDKHHLVPFGEFIPWGFRWFTQMMNIPLGDFARGPAVPASFAVLGQRLAPNICYEDLFGEELARRFVDRAQAPTIMVNLSNIGWFGDTVAIDQHLGISRLRALELARPMIRATNTGATAIVDHRGRVTALLPRLTRGVLEGEVEGRHGTTPYAWWAGRAGLWPLWVAAFAVVAGLAWRKAP